METILTPPNIMFIIGLLSVLFSIFLYFKNPQDSLDKREALNQKENDAENRLLGYQVTADREATDRRFSEMMKRIDDAMALAQNHTHTVDTKVDTLTGVVNMMNIQFTKEFTRLGTIIEERFPKT